VTRRFLLLALFALFALGCSSSSSTPPANDTGTDEDTAEAGLPPLDPKKCPSVTGDEAPMSFSRDYVPLASASVVEDKAFYLVTVLDSASGVRDAIAADATLTTIGNDRDARFRKATTDCAGKLTCIVDALGFSEADAKSAADALAKDLSSSALLDLVAKKHLRPSGMFNLHAADADDALVKDAFVDTTVALSQTLQAIGSELAADKLDAAMKSVASAHAKTMLFYEPLNAVVLAVMTASGRDEAARYEPMIKGENAKAIARMASIDFNAFPFTAIVVPGLGPLDLSVALSEGGRIRADMAADRFAAKLAPFIVLSGGHVHPDRTPYSEAIEMKKYLMKSRGIPEDALLVDPHARHTTTNLRNVARLFFRYGIPVDRPALVTTDLGQSGYMQGAGFSGRCSRELGYLPWRVLAPLSPLDTCFLSSRASLHADGRDALDP